ncbi:MAG: alanine--tRNA ligase [Nitrospiraceae bacterium]|nr:alanine--tRNA ligase [Nitrospiraceae bacterium]
MVNEKEIKKQIIKETRDHPEKYFPVNKLKALGFKRYQCEVCGRFFWSSKPRNVCGDISCQGSYTFLNKDHKIKLDFINVWNKFKEMFSSLDYKPISRYPVMARWNPTMEFTIASIADFQPYVVNGDIPPPSKKLIVPQPCLRFNDIDNVGITGSHYTSFTMIGQHAFLPSDLFDQEQYFEDYLTWFTDALKLDKSEIIIHEDGWAGGGNVGPCLEFFSGGLELGNQVYHQYKISPDGSLIPLKLKVLDMGMGQERVAWFTNGTLTSYEVSMPTAMAYLESIIPFTINKEILSKFVPYSGKLNSDEVKNIEQMWEKISSDIKININELKNNVHAFSAIASIADHTRTLLYALNDGALPSNVGGGYNLRVIFRRAYDLAKKYNIPIDWGKIFEIHANYLKPMYPELTENLEEIKKIINVEIDKYRETKKKNQQIIINLIKKSEHIDEDKLIKLYDSYGILPEEIEKTIENTKSNVTLGMSKNFYSKLNEIHQSTKFEKTKTKRLFPYDISNIKNTEILYFDDFKLTDFKAKVLKIIDNYVILNKTAFYPTSGGQIHDKGIINNQEVKDIFKYNGKIIHELKESPSFKEGDEVVCSIDFEHRLQLTQHHTAVHIVNGACRHLLGSHVWQAGASKTFEKARLDITHYALLTDKEINEIEHLSNSIIEQNLPVYKSMMAREAAEARYGFRIYQGGFVPGKVLRIVEIPNWDVEACGGTHVDLTGEVGSIRIIKTTKVQDGVIRIELVAGKAVERIEKHEQEIINELKDLLNCETIDIVPRVKELLKKWKLIKKKKRTLDPTLTSKGTESLSNREIIKQSAEILSTQKEHIINTVRRFLRDINP